MTERVRMRLLLLVLGGLLAWFAWSEQRRAADELDAVRQSRTQTLRQGAAAERERERRELLSRVVERLEERPAPPGSAAAVREVFLRAAGEQGVELSSSRLQPVVRPPAGTAGTEARITLLGDPPALIRFLGAIGNRRWPLRIDRATLAVRGGLGTLTTTALVLWPDVAASFTEEDAVRFAADDRMDRLLAWLEAAPSPRTVAAVSAREPPPAPISDHAPEPVTEPAPGVETAPGAARPETPELRGFVDVDPETPVRAALYYLGETRLVAIGDRVGEYTVLTIEPSAAVILARPDGPPLRLVLR